MKNNPYTFRSGFVQNRDIGRVIAVIDEISDQGVDRCQLMKWNRPDQNWQYFPLNWAVTRMCVLDDPEFQVVATGPDGVVSVVTLSGNTEEYIDDSNHGIRARGPIRDMRKIGGHLYVTGMGRQVYRREGQNRWGRFDHEMARPIGSTEICGFNAIDGLSESDMYVVGFGGEIWHYIQSKWQSIESPTNLALHRVKAVEPKLVFVSGQKGILIKGSGNSWEIIQHGKTDKDLWGIEWYKGKLYIACDDGLFVYNRNNEIVKINIELGKNLTFRHLHANDGVLWSFGPKNIIWTEDGKSWYEVTPGTR